MKPLTSSYTPLSTRTETTTGLLVSHDSQGTISSLTLLPPTFNRNLELGGLDKKLIVSEVSVTLGLDVGGDPEALRAVFERIKTHYRVEASSVVPELVRKVTGNH